MKWKVLGSLAVLFLGISGAQTGDPRYGYVGTGALEFAEKSSTYTYGTFGNHIPGTTIIQNLAPAGDPWPPWARVVRRIGLLEARNDGLGESPDVLKERIEKYGRKLADYYKLGGFGTKPQFTWYRPNVPALIAADSAQILAAIERDKWRRVEPRIWEIGNEPNLFPSIDPADYAALFMAYYKLIKRHDPDAIVLFGAVFMTELIPADAQDKIIQILNSRMYKEMWNGVPFVTTSGSFIEFFGGGLINGFLAAYSAPVIEWTKDDVRRLLTNRMWRYKSGHAYLRAVMDYFKSDGYLFYDFLSDRTQPSSQWGVANFSNRVSVHVYPCDLATIKSDVDNYYFVADALKKYRDSLYFVGTPGQSNFLTKTFLHSPIWVTELGNINYRLTAAQVSERFLYLLSHWGQYGTDPMVSGQGWQYPPALWLWYKPIGIDAKFAQVLPGKTPPYTRLIDDKNFVMDPVNLSHFPCSALGPVGRMYMQQANWFQISCQD